MTTQGTTGVWKLVAHSITEMVQLAVQAEERGVESVWGPDGG